MNSNNRTWKEINEILDIASIKKNNLLPNVDVIYYPEHKIDHNYKLLQLDNKLIENFIPGTRVLICGDKHDPAVLCTSKNTFELKESVNFNSILLFKDLSSNLEHENGTEEPQIFKREVLGTFDKLYETRLCQSRTKKITQLLKPTIFKGKEYERDLEASGVTFYTFETLRVNIQASDEDIIKEFKNNNVVTYKGFLRMLEHSYHFEVLTTILNFIEENSWTYNQINKEEVLGTLSNLIPEEILSECFNWYTKILGNGLFELNEYEICRFYGHVLLKPSQRFNLNDFLEVWKNSVPEGMITNENQLLGLAFRDTKSIPPAMRYFPEIDLPESLNERLNMIFQAREKWTLEQITPYLSRMTTPSMDVGKLLTIYTRSEMINGTRYYGPKHK